MYLIEIVSIYTNCVHITVHYAPIFSLHTFFSAEIAVFTKKGSQRLTHSLLVEWITGFFNYGRPPVPKTEQSDDIPESVDSKKRVEIVAPQQQKSTTVSKRHVPPLLLQQEGTYRLTFIKLTFMVYVCHKDMQLCAKLTYGVQLILY